jgi:nudix-type nucleoside diphosphatase (YffH/AdpP family)
MPPELIDEKLIHDGWGKFLIASFRLGDGALIRREIEDHGDAVGVLPYDPVNRTAILVRQFRAPVFYSAGLAQTLEVIAGGLQSEDARACVQREAIEEAGLRLHDLEHVVSAFAMPGVSTMRIELYLATYSQQDRIGKGGGVAEEREDITVVEIGLSELARVIDEGKCVDLTTAFLTQTLRCRRPDLFAAP